MLWLAPGKSLAPLFAATWVCLAVDKAKDQLEKAKKEFKAYERNLDQLETQLGQLESDYANKVPGIRYDDLLELREIIKGSTNFSSQAGFEI